MWDVLMVGRSVVRLSGPPVKECPHLLSHLNEACYICFHWRWDEHDIFSIMPTCETRSNAIRRVRRFRNSFFRQSSIFSMTKWRWGYWGIRKFWPDTKDYISMCTNMAGTKTCLAVTWKFNAHFAIHPPISHLVYLSNKHQVTVFVLYMETK